MLSNNRKKQPVIKILRYKKILESSVFLHVKILIWPNVIARQKLTTQSPANQQESCLIVFLGHVISLKN